MDLLILGGTIFLGRHLVEAAAARGHQLTLFHRGQHGVDLFPQVERLLGDRKVDLSPLHGRHWDAAIDTCGYVPRVVRSSAEALAGSVDHYTFISSISVYADLSRPETDETSPVGVLADPTTEEVTGDTYGPLKALCEQAAEDALPGRVLNVRPGLIVGPHDPSHRFTYWPRRIAEGGEVLAPGDPSAPIQIIDVRDLADWLIRMVEARVTGSFNAVGPDYRLSFGELLDTCREVSGSDAAVTWVDEAFLLAAQVTPYSELPLWVPASEGGEGFNSVGLRAARERGLGFRPLRDTIADTLAWYRSGAPNRGASLTESREADLLARWHGRVAGSTPEQDG